MMIKLSRSRSLAINIYAVLYKLYSFIAAAKRIELDRVKLSQLSAQVLNHVIRFNPTRISNNMKLVTLASSFLCNRIYDYLCQREAPILN